MKYILVIDGADNCVYDIFATTDEDHALIFPNGTDIAFAEDFPSRVDGSTSDDSTWDDSTWDASPLWAALNRLWDNRVPKTQAVGIHGTIFYELPEKRKYYPTLKDEDAMNPNGTRLRKDGAYSEELLRRAHDEGE